MTIRSPRQRPRISIDVTEKEMERIDQARGPVPRTVFAKERIFLSDGFSDPVHGVISRLLGNLSALHPHMWDTIYTINKLQLSATFEKRRLGHCKTNHDEELVGCLRRIEKHLDRLAAMAIEQKCVLNEIKNDTSKLVEAMIPDERTSGHQSGLQWHRRKK